MRVLIARLLFEFCCNAELKQLRLFIALDVLTFIRFHSFNVNFNFTYCRFYRVIINVPSSEAVLFYTFMRWCHCVYG